MGQSRTDRQDSSEDALWIEAIVTGDHEEQEAAYGKLFAKYWKLLVVLSGARMRDPREAEDVAQEAFIRAFRSIGQLDQPAAFLGWLLKIHRNLLTDHLRARRARSREHTVSDGLGEMGEGTTFLHWREPTSFQEEIETQEEVERVLKAMAGLPELYREALALRYVQGLEGKEMARRLGEPEGTVRNRLFRAIEKLRAALPEAKERFHDPRA
jgi:RNA polymerase sigma-70 factor (ECF subfamily)